MHRVVGANSIANRMQGDTEHPIGKLPIDCETLYQAFEPQIGLLHGCAKNIESG